MRRLFVLLVALVISGAWVASAGALTFTVNSSLDPGDDACTTDQCTLRAAILAANANAGPDIIAFKIGTGVKTIAVASALPGITSPVTIDGTTQPGFTGSPIIELSGELAGAADGLTIVAGSSTVRGLVVNRFAGAGIVLFTNGGNLVAGNYVGTDVTGTVDFGNGTGGVAIDAGSSGNTVGGTAASARNVISGNGSSNGGVFLGAAGNIVVGNFIGTNAAGTAALGNVYGVVVVGTNNAVGGTAPGARNVISGNSNGISFTSSGPGNFVRGNYIGTDLTGSAAIGNSDGILIDASSGNTIGGVAAGAGNLISGNTTAISVGSASAGNLVQGNLVGTNAAGTAALGNLEGITIQGGSNHNTIGGTASGAGNVISASTGGDGVFLNNATTSANVVQGNLIGTDRTGTVALGNSAHGVNVNDSPSNTIGGTVAGARNVISGNGTNGIDISGATATGNVVLGNYVGLAADGSTPLGNSGVGIRVTGAGSNTIGGLTAGARNVISDNGYGINVDGFANPASANVIQGNYVGTNAAGTGGRGNGVGVRLFYATDTTIGGTAAGARNVISASVGAGISILGDGSTSQFNTVAGNFIGTNATGTSALGNGVGIFLENAPGNTIGGSAPGSRNLISGNDGNGISITDVSTGTVVRGNFIGTTAAGTGPLGNGDTGVVVFLSNNVIGSNRVAFNGRNGVSVNAPTGTGNAITANSIYENGLLGIDLGNDGITLNDAGDADSGANNLQNYPILTSATTAGISTATGTLNSTASTTFRVELFANPACDDSGRGEGERLVGLVNVSTNASGDASFSIPLSGPVASGELLTATATDPSGNTSEFSQCLLVTGGAGSTAAGDFNGDGFSDLAIGVPSEDLGTIANAGAVNVIYGSSTGLNATTVPDQLWTQDSTGVLETAEAGDAFGSALAAGDINGDGKADLLIGVPGEDVGATPAGVNAGAFQVLRGSATGLTSTGNQLFVQTAPERNDFFGAAVTTGDFNGDGKADAAAGSPGEDVGTIVDGGQVNVYAGSATGLSTTAQVWTQDSANVEDFVEAGDRFGSALTSGDFNGGGKGDLAVGVPGEDIAASDQGAVNVLYGSATGLSATAIPDQLLTATSGAVQDGFGSALAAGDINGGTSDLAVGLPGFTAGFEEHAGAAAVFFGAAAGFALTPDQRVTQDSAGVAGVAEENDILGSTLAIGDFNADSKGDLAIGVPGEDLAGGANGGAVNVLYGSATGLTATGNRLFTQDSNGIADQVERGDQFGASLTVGRFNAGLAVDLAIGIPSEDIGAITNAGAVSVLYGLASTGLNISNQFWNQDTPNIEDAAEPNDGFGWAVG